MAVLYKLTAGKTLTATAVEGRIHVRSDVGSAFTRSAVTFGPYLVDTDWLVDGDASVVLADYSAPFNALVFESDGAPDDAAQASLSVNPTGDDNAVIFTAREYGAGGNAITVAYTDPGGATAALSVSVFRQAITVSLARAASSISSTAADVLAAVQANNAANELVTVALDESDSNFSDGSGVVTAMAEAPLADGAGTAVGVLKPGGLLVDSSNGNVYRNSGTLAAPAFTQLGDAA